ncbi:MULTISPECIES: ABC transporter substrate-binding protein [Peribacillus]|uniref:ABC transporter substrate-binding protein n=1 Tax=Peribacillus TaxID=2675229 RepID=UPI00203B7731|nr:MULTISPECIES: ABC transporter substrate-binding protein [Peribacillus]MCM3675846.1 ABC transporter substrate-binding protein [Peribacillus simplex]MDQ0880574.1 peptide/nickel transport system substrate-binding protein [Peribacillus sp. V2I11]
MMNKRQYKSFSIFGGVLFWIVILLAGCAEVKNHNAGSINEDVDKKATLAFPWSPSNLDPHGNDNWEVMRSGTAETLVKLNEELEPTPWLAKGWKQENELTWIFELESNVRFHNGKKMDAASVKESLLRSLQKNQRTKDLLQVESIEVLTQNELKIVTKQPNAALISHLADPSTIIVDVTSIEGKDNYPALTGPFTFKKFNKGESLVVQRYKDYWGKQALLSEITIKFIPDGNTRLMALQSGDVDAATDISIDSIPLLEQDKEIDVLTAPSLRTHMLMFNMKSPLLKELANRKVINMSIPRGDIVSSVMNEQGEEANGPFPAILPFAKVEEMKENQTIDQLIKQEDWKKNKDGILERQGKPFEVKMLTFPQRPELSVMAETIQNELLKIGIKVNIQQVENIDDALANDSWDLSMYSMLTAHTGEPQYFLNIFYKSTSESNVSHYASSSLDSLIDQLNKTTDSKTRNQLAIHIQEIIIKDIPQSFIVNPKTVFGVRNGVKGFSPSPIEYYYIHSQIDING